MAYGYHALYPPRPPKKNSSEHAGTCRELVRQHPSGTDGVLIVGLEGKGWLGPSGDLQGPSARPDPQCTPGCRSPARQRRPHRLQPPRRHAQAGCEIFSAFRSFLVDSRNSPSPNKVSSVTTTSTTYWNGTVLFGGYLDVAPLPA